jgi:hypothetical protein
MTERELSWRCLAGQSLTAFGPSWLRACPVPKPSDILLVLHVGARGFTFKRVSHFPFGFLIARQRFSSLIYLQCCRSVLCFQSCTCLRDFCPRGVQRYLSRSPSSVSHVSWWSILRRLHTAAFVLNNHASPSLDFFTRSFSFLSPNMEISHPDHWPCLATIFELMVSVCSIILDAFNHAARAIGPCLWSALQWTEYLLAAAGNALLAAVLVLLLWFSIIYLCCFTIFMFCKLLRRHQKSRSRGERQPLLLPQPQRRRRLPSWTSSNSSSERRRHLDHQAHRDLFRADMDRRRQDVLRREQHRAIESRSRQYRERRLREALQQSMSTPMYGQPQTIITWLQTSAGSTTITQYPHYGTLPTRGAQSRPERRADPPPPYSHNAGAQPPPYSIPRHDSPPAYD